MTGHARSLPTMMKHRSSDPIADYWTNNMTVTVVPECFNDDITGILRKRKIRGK